MVQDRFNADQRSCGLRRHLDSVPPDTPIRELIVLGVGESLGAEEGSFPGTYMYRGHTMMASDPGSPRYFWKIHSGQLGALRLSHGFRYPWLVWSRMTLLGPRGGECAEPKCFSRETALSDCTAATGCPGRQSGRGEGASGRWSAAAISHAVCGDVGTEPGIGGGAGDGVFLVWSSVHGVN